MVGWLSIDIGPSRPKQFNIENCWRFYHCAHEYVGANERSGIICRQIKIICGNTDLFVLQDSCERPDFWFCDDLVIVVYYLKPIFNFDERNVFAWLGYLLKLREVVKITEVRYYSPLVLQRLDQEVINYNLEIDGLRDGIQICSCVIHDSGC